MRRREFITLVGGAATWPLGVRAQQGGMPTIGLLWPADAPPVFPRMESFRQGLRASGLVEGQNVALELRYAQRGPQQLPELAAELVRLKVDAIFTGGDLAARVLWTSDNASSGGAASALDDLLRRLPAS